MKILVVEDERKVAAFIQQGLEELGNQVDVAFDGLTGKKMAEEKRYDFLVLDLLLPGMSGLEVCKALRAKQPRLPILMLTALGTSEDKLAGFDSGADDYLVKPFEFSELVARIKALVRRANPDMEGNKLVVGDLELDTDKKLAIRSGQIITLTAKEYSLLEYLMLNKGKVVSRQQIAGDVWDIHFDTGTNVVDVYVNFLRKKIDKDFETKLIQTMIGMGYMIDA
ncbi:MAG: response regulator transcription factor [Sphingobacteriaceae bacterium]|nr:response regulator transcription factor [Sphingobacteriaceae bacterium]